MFVVRVALFKGIRQSEPHSHLRTLSLYSVRQHCHLWFVVVELFTAELVDKMTLYVQLDDIQL